MKIILDTDLTNEIDDCFALVYLLKCGLSNKVLAITLEPYDTFWQTYDNRTTMVRNNLEAHKILKLMNDGRQKMIYAGSKQFYNIAIKKDKKIEAVDKIINLALTEKVTILATGCLTNIALALTKCPTIAQNITLIWLGGRNTKNQSAKVEFNLRQDIESAQIVFKEINDITMIWSKEIASNIQIPRTLLINTLKQKNNISDYLLSKYLNLPKIETEKIKNLYDVTVPIYLIRPDLYTINDIYISDITKDGTYIIGGNKKVKYCTSIETKAIIEEFLKVVAN